MKKALAGIGVFAGIVVFIFILELTGLGFFKFFGPKRENIRREIFENTQSYTHGKTQDLAKFYGEYNKAESTADRDAIASLIKMQFADFDETKLRNDKLRNFLQNIRGY